MVYVGDALLETQSPQMQLPSRNESSSGSHVACRHAAIYAGVLAASIMVVVVASLISSSNDGVSAVPVVEQHSTNTPGHPTLTPRPTPTPRPTATPTPIPYVTVGDILATFKANPARGKIDYMEEHVYVKGKVRAFNDSDSRVVYLTPETTWETEDYEVFLVRLATLQQAASLSRGDEISMLCKIGSGYAFPHGHEIECSPVGPVSLPPTPTPSPIPTPTPIPSPAALSTPLPAETTTTQATPTLVVAQPMSTPTFEERRQAVIDMYCGGSNYAQACVEKVGSDYCVEFYENPPQYYDRYSTCTYFGF